MKHTALLLGWMMFTTCSDYLNTEHGGFLLEEQLQQSFKENQASILDNLMNGIYTTTFMAGTGGTVRSDDFGQKSIDICLDFMCGDLASTGNVAFFMGVYKYLYQARTGVNAGIIWRYYYSIINGANKIFDLLGSDTNLPENPTACVYYAQAKVMRAYAYFYLVNLYQHPYSDKKDAPGVPVYRSQVDMKPQRQSTVKEVYDLLISDLEDAVVALENYDRGKNKTKIDKNVTLGFLAYAYLTRGEAGDYQKSADAARSVIESGKFALMTEKEVIESGFSSLNISSWIWGIDLTIENTPKDFSFWGNMDCFTNGWCVKGYQKMIDADLYIEIPATDVRKKQFGSPFTGVIGEPPLAPINKFYDSERIYGGDKLYTNDLVYMRIEEMYLVLAEALARLGKSEESLLSLKSLMSLRNPSANLTNLSNAELLETIWFNWRAEMWGEGKTYFAMKRFKKTVRRAANHSQRAGESFSYNYERMIFEIPEYEWVNNPNLVQQQ
ncbi:MAG: RagB/SusD family nutrient uptake outer membrane protein [Candidatus Symbiothrix sp.]|jgi:hypothetical protein|nr:RagB/SusD family nutrient uptake outer membrane protein [Candidatus Symbiothrix sp.]